jgi:ribosome-associated heat shock protein Hsp15
MNHVTNPFEASSKLRLDKWLWAARFFKTRSLAVQAIERGKVRVEGEAVKPAKEIKVGDLLQMTHGETPLELTVLALSDVRRGAPEAQQLYEETPASTTRRQAAALQRKMAPEPAAQLHGRPTKRQRRDLNGFTCQ